MTLHVTTTAIRGKLHQMLIYNDGTYIGEYERSQEQEIERKKREIGNAEALLLEVFRRHGPFVVRWDGKARQKSIRVNDVEVGVVPKSAWESPSWESGGPRRATASPDVAVEPGAGDVALSAGPVAGADAMRVVPPPNEKLREVLLQAYRPCCEFSSACMAMRWNPAEGHVPRGFCGATGALDEVDLVLVMAEPGDPHHGESHPEDPGAALASAFEYAYGCYSSGKDLYHRNVRRILDSCFPGLSFDEQMRRTWMTESVLCSAIREGAAVPGPVEVACRARYLDAQLCLFPSAVVVALGGKAARRLKGRPIITAFAAPPPGCNFRGARESWEAIAKAVHARAGRSGIEKG